FISSYPDLRHIHSFPTRRSSDLSIVIPQKDRHQYSAAFNKIANARNARRLVEKLWDQFALGKHQEFGHNLRHARAHAAMAVGATDRKSTRLNSSHDQISYAVFCL